MTIVTTAIIFALLVAADLVSKAVVSSALISAGGALEFIPGLIRFEYVENTGMAWGLLKNSTLLLALVSLLASILIGFLIIRYRRAMPTLLRLALTLILSGAVGNVVDRLALGYVRDFIAFDFIRFPVFNFADSCVSVGAALLVISLAFTKKGRAFFSSLDSGRKNDDARSAASQND